MKSPVKLWWLAAMLGLSGLVMAGCQSSPGTEANISLSEAIALSKTHNIQKVVVEQDKGTMTLTAAVTGASLKITDTSGNQVEVTNGMQLAANIDSLNIADLQAMGFVLPSEYSTNAASGGITGTLLVLLPVLLLFIW